MSKICRCYIILSQLLNSLALNSKSLQELREWRSPRWVTNPAFSLPLRERFLHSNNISLYLDPGKGPGFSYSHIFPIVTSSKYQFHGQLNQMMTFYDVFWNQRHKTFVSFNKFFLVKIKNLLFRIRNRILSQWCYNGCYIVRRPLANTQLLNGRISVRFGPAISLTPSLDRVRVRVKGWWLMLRLARWF